MKIIRSLVATCIFLLLLVASYFVHVRYFEVNVVFYAAIADALIAAILSTVLILRVRYFNILDELEKLYLVVIWLLLGYSLAISVPTVIDRSLSFYILEKIQQRGGGIRQDAIAGVFKNEYMKEYRLVDVRLTEQLETGTIEIKNGCVLLTHKGKTLADIGNFFRGHLLPKRRLLMGEYTDDLTNPFKNSSRVIDYACQ